MTSEIFLSILHRCPWHEGRKQEQGIWEDGYSSRWEFQKNQKTPLSFIGFRTIPRGGRSPERRQGSQGGLGEGKVLGTEQHGLITSPQACLKNVSEGSIFRTTLLGKKLREVSEDRKSSDTQKRELQWCVAQLIPWEHCCSGQGPCSWPYPSSWHRSSLLSQEEQLHC